MEELSRPQRLIPHIPSPSKRPFTVGHVCSVANSPFVGIRYSPGHSSRYGVSPSLSYYSSIYGASPALSERLTSTTSSPAVISLYQTPPYHSIYPRQPAVPKCMAAYLPQRQLLSQDALFHYFVQPVYPVYDELAVAPSRGNSSANFMSNTGSNTTDRGFEYNIAPGLAALARQRLRSEHSESLGATQYPPINPFQPNDTSTTSDTTGPQIIIADTNQATWDFLQEITEEGLIDLLNTPQLTNSSGTTDTRTEATGWLSFGDVLYRPADNCLEYRPEIPD